MSRDSRPANTPWVTGRIDDVTVATADGSDITGGRVITLIAGAALKLGDAVYLSGTRTVNKSNSAANHPKAIGIVVGGRSTNDRVIGDKAAYGVLTAAASGEEVIVCISGICYVVVDAAIAVGVAIALSTTTAGKVRPATNLAVAATGLTIAAGATPVTSSAANGAIISGSGTASGDGLQATAIIGKILETASADGSVVAALINV